MNIERLISTSDVLFKVMKEQHYTDSTIEKYICEIHWIQKHGKDKDFSSYVNLCNYRLERKRASVGVSYSHRSMYRVFKDFAENNQFPLHDKRNPLQPIVLTGTPIRKPPISSSLIQE